MRILVTGGAGFISSALCRRLVLAEGAVVLNLDKLTYAGHLTSLEAVAGHPRYHFLECDICDAPRIAEAIGDFRPEALLHLAAESHVDRSIKGPAPFIATNITGTYVLLEAAQHYALSLAPADRERFRFLHVSTDEVFGSLGPVGAFSEASPLCPSSPYSASKAAADHLALAWHCTFGLNATVINCSNAYGPYQMPEKLVPLMILNALDSLPLPVYGDGLNVRDWMHVDDFVSALLAVLAKGRAGHRYTAGARNERSNIEVVQKIGAILDRLAPKGAPHARLITHIADRPGHDRRYAIGPGQLERETGWCPAIDYEAGLESTVRWYLDNPGWWKPLRVDIVGER